MRDMRSLASTLLIALLTALPGQGARTPRPSPPLDILILHGHVVDGTGNPWIAADVGIRAGRIVAIGDLRGAQARRTLDATGLVVAPGFVDMHSHSEAALLNNGGAGSKIYEGVTTEVMGETAAVACGGPFAGPALAHARSEFAAVGLRMDWTTLGGFFRRLERQGIRLNALSYAGLGPIRESVRGMADGPPTPQQLAREEAMMAQAMRDGAFGLATGLSYPPDVFTQTPEIVALAKVAARFGGIYATHVRSLDAPGVPGLDEAITIGREAGLPVHVFHLQVSRSDGPEAATQALQTLQRARHAGVEVTADAYPYRAAANPLSSIVDPEFIVGGEAALAARLKDPALRPRIVASITASARRLATPDDPTGFTQELISRVRQAPDLKYVGKTFAEVGRLDRLPPAEAIANLLMREQGAGGRIFFNKSAESVRQILRVPWISVGGDAIDTDLTRRSPFASAHPRSFGTHSRIVGPWVRDEHLFTLEQAVQKMTSLPAQTLRLRDRGLLKPGFAADVIVFDPATVGDRATYADPFQYSVGMKAVLVNGVPVLWDGKPTAARPGRVLRGPGTVR